MKLTDRVLDRATDVDLRRILVWLVVAVPFAAAWLAGKLVKGLMVALSWVIAAVQDGYKIARS